MQQPLPDDTPIVPLSVDQLIDQTDKFRSLMERMAEITRLSLEALGKPEDEATNERLVELSNELFEVAYVAMFLAEEVGDKIVPLPDRLGEIATPGKESHKSKRTLIKDDMAFIESALRDNGPLSPHDIFALGFRPDLTDQSRRSHFQSIMSKLDVTLVDENGESRIERTGKTRNRRYSLKDTEARYMPTDTAVSLDPDAAPQVRYVAKNPTPKSPEKDAPKDILTATHGAITTVVERNKKPVITMAEIRREVYEGDLNAQQYNALFYALRTDGRLTYIGNKEYHVHGRDLNTRISDLEINDIITRILEKADKMKISYVDIRIVVAQEARAGRYLTTAEQKTLFAHLSESPRVIKVEDGIMTLRRDYGDSQESLEKRMRRLNLSSGQPRHRI